MNDFKINFDLNPHLGVWFHSFAITGNIKAIHQSALYSKSWKMISKQG